MGAIKPVRMAGSRATDVGRAVGGTVDGAGADKMMSIVIVGLVPAIHVFAA